MEEGESHQYNLLCCVIESSFSVCVRVPEKGSTHAQWMWIKSWRIKVEQVDKGVDNKIQCSFFKNYFIVVQLELSAFTPHHSLPPPPPLVLSMCPIPQLRLVGVRTSYIYFFLIFPGHPEFWTPLQIPICAPTLGCTLLQFWFPFIMSFQKSGYYDSLFLILCLVFKYLKIFMILTIIESQVLGYLTWHKNIAEFLLIWTSMCSYPLQLSGTYI